jgi:hypothetical protein
MRKEKSDIITILNSLQFTGHIDSALWLWDSSRSYMIKSLYIFLCFGEGVIINLSKLVWTLKIPLKNKLFL